LLLGIPIKPKSLGLAAMMVGSSPQYVAAMKTLIKADAWSLIDAVLASQVPILEAADSMRNRAKLFTAYAHSDLHDRAALGEFAGTAVIWDDVLVPNIS
jgi:hypothetical protein